MLTNSGKFLWSNFFADFVDIPTFIIHKILALDMYILSYVRLRYTLGPYTIILLCEQQFLEKLVMLYIAFSLL
jgi:hypothetical protein